MEDLIKRSDAIKHFKAKADHYRKRLARIEAQGDAICYDPTDQINGFKDEIAIYEDVAKQIEDIPSAEEWKDECDRAYSTGWIRGMESAEKQGENATRCYEFLKTKLGESIVDSKKEFESWYERMVWHVKECDRLAREPKQGEWIPNSPYTGLCSECGGEGNLKNNFCPNCGARMAKK